MTEISNVAIVGAGTMGAGIAISAINAGLPTVLADVGEDALARASQRIQAYFDRQVAKGRLDEDGAQQRLAALTTTTELAGCGGADLVIEAVFEDLAIKQDLMRRLSPVIAADAVVATNTSCLRVAEVASALTAPERMCGLHYFSPAEINPVVELVRTEATADTVVAAAAGFLQRTGKTAIRCRDVNGFAINRFFCPYTNEAARCLDDGLGTTGQIDAVARETFELALGPFAVMNIIKPQVNLHAIRNLGSLGPFYGAAASMSRVGDAGEAWPIAEDDAPVSGEARVAIADRLRGALFFTVLQELDEGVADAADIDRGARDALRFGRPPVAAMRELGDAEVLRLVRDIAARFGETPPPLAPLLAAA